MICLGTFLGDGAERAFLISALIGGNNKTLSHSQFRPPFVAAVSKNQDRAEVIEGPPLVIRKSRKLH